MDIPEEDERWPEVEKFLKEKGYQAMPISAATGQNVQAVLWKLYEMLQNVPEELPTESLPVYLPKEDPRKFEITKDA